MPIANLFPQFTAPGTEIAEAPKEFEAIRAKILEGQQRNRELSETELYHKRSLDIHQAASNRAEKLLPYMVQQYKDTHAGKITENDINHLNFQITKKFYDEAMKEKPPTQTTTSPTPQPQESLPELQDQSTQQKLVQPGSQIPGTPSLADIMQNFMPVGIPQKQPMQNMQQQIKQQIYNPGLNIQNSSVFQTDQAAQEQQPVQAQNSGSKTLSTGETEIAPGNPNLYFADKMAGHVKSIPAPQVHFGKDGMIYTRYPSGRTTMVNAGGGTGSTAGMTPEQKLQNQKDMEEAKESNREKLASYKDTLTEAKEDRKEARDIRAKAFPVEHILHSIDTIREIYNRNKKFTGPGVAFGKNLGMLDKKDLGALQAAFGDIQAAVAHNASQKGGAQVIRWAGTVKPSLFNPQNFNLGMVDTLENAALYDYSAMNRDHKNLVKRDLPAHNERVKQYEQGNSGNPVKTITVITSDGQDQDIDEDKFDEAKKIDPGVRRK